MKRSAQILMRIYARLLSLYPQPYRSKYGEEQQTVFRLVVEDAAHQGTFSIIKLGWCELRDLPGAVLCEHLRERRKRKMATKTSVLPTFEPGSWCEGLAAVAPFLLLGALVSLLNYLHPTFPRWLEIVIAFGLFLIPLLLLFALGLIKGLPRWFLPYAGLVGSFLSLDLANRLFFGVLYLEKMTRTNLTASVLVSRLLFGVLRPSDPWIGLLGVAAFIVLITVAWRPLRPFYLRIRADWTLLSFGLYGATLMALFWTFDDYPHPQRHPYVLLASLILAAGAWVYLRSARPWQRFLALFAGITLSMAVAATGKGILCSGPFWPRALRRFTWQTEVLSTVFLWGWLVAVVLAPALLRLLPRPDKPLPAG